MDKKLSYLLLINRLCKIDSPDEMRWLLGQLLTDAEIQDVVDRVRIYDALSNTEWTQREIAKRLGVSITKVTRGSSNIHSRKLRLYFQENFSEC